MKLRLTLAILLISSGLAMPVGIIHLRWRSGPLPFPPPNSGHEQFGTGVNTAGNTSLFWNVFMHTDIPRPMGIVVHGGKFRAGNPGPSAVCRDVYEAGYNCAVVQYRLADPGNEMRPPNGDQPVDDHGHWPEQLDDISQAILAARNGTTPRTAGLVTGKVFGIGGSAGATHVADLTGAALHGGDKFDAGVGLSGAYDFHDPASWPTHCADSPYNVFTNYVGCVPNTPTCDDNGGSLDLASAYQKFGPTSSPFIFFTTNNDPMPPNQYTLMVSYLTSVGATFSSRSLSEAAYFTNGCTRHAFSYWHAAAGFPDEVQTEAMAFIATYVPPP